MSLPVSPALARFLREKHHKHAAATALSRTWGDLGPVRPLRWGPSAMATTLHRSGGGGWGDLGSTGTGTDTGTGTGTGTNGGDQADAADGQLTTAPQELTPQELYYYCYSAFLSSPLEQRPTPPTLPHEPAVTATTN